MIYLVLSAVTLALLYGVYRLVLSRTTLHRFNRTVLLSILALSFILPAVRIEGLSVFPDKRAIVETPLLPENDTKGDRPQWYSFENDTKGDRPQLYQAVQTIDVTSKVLQISLTDVLTYLYIVGVVFFILRLFIGIIRAETLCRLGGRRLADGSRLVVCDGDFQPTSWLNTIIMSRNPVTKEMLVSGMGDQHIEIIMERMKRKFGVEADLRAPQVEYRETIRGKAHVQGKHKKQSGGHGQYGDVVIDMEPLPPGSGFEFVDKIFGGAVPRQYIPAVEKGMQECMQHGILAGYPVVDVRITLVDGSYHPVDSSEMAFKTASSIAFKKAMEESKPVLMEPYYNLYVLCAESMMGDVIGDLNSKRGRILGMQSVEEGISRVEAQVPYAEIMEYAVDLRALTQGMGTFEMKFDHYEDVPAKMAEKIIEERKKEAE